MAFLRFWAPFWGGGSGSTYDDHLRLIGKGVVDFLLVLIELFFTRCYGSETLRAIISSKSALWLQRGPLDPKFQVEEVAPTNHSFSLKTRLNVLSYGIKSGLIFLWFCHNSRVWETDGRTDRQNLIVRPRLHSTQRGKNYADWDETRWP